MYKRVITRSEKQLERPEESLETDNLRVDDKEESSQWPYGSTRTLRR